MTAIPLKYSVSNANILLLRIDESFNLLVNSKIIYLYDNKKIKIYWKSSEDETDSIHPGYYLVLWKLQATEIKYYLITALFSFVI